METPRTFGRNTQKLFSKVKTPQQRVRMMSAISTPREYCDWQRPGMAHVLQSIRLILFGNLYYNGWVLYQISLIFQTVDKQQHQFMILILSLLFVAAIASLNVKTIIGMSQILAPQFTDIQVFQIEMNRLTSSRNGTENVCWPNRRFLNYENQDQKFNIPSIAQSLQSQGTNGSKNQSDTQSIVDFAVTEQKDIYVLTSLGKAYYSKDINKQTPHHEQIKIPQEHKQQLANLSKFHLLAISKGAIIITEKNIILLAQNNYFLIKNYEPLNNITRVEFIKDSNTMLLLFVLTDNNIYVININIESKTVVSASKLPLIQYAKVKQLMKINDFSIDKQNKVFYVLDEGKGMFQIKYQKIEDSTPASIQKIFTIEKCYSLKHLHPSLILTCKSKNSTNDYVAELFFNKSNSSYQSRIQQDQQQTIIHSVQILPGYYIVSRKQQIQFYVQMNRFNINDKKHVNVNQIQIDPLIKSQLIQYQNHYYFYYANNVTLSKIALKESPSSIYCFSYISLEQTYSVVYKGICNNNVTCVKRSSLSFRSYEYKYLFVLIDFLWIVAVIGLYFYKKDKNPIIESAENSFEMLEFNQNSDPQDKQL